MKVLNVSKEGLKNVAFTINPWLYLAFKVFTLKLNFNTTDWIIFSTTLIFGAISLITTSNISVLLQIVALFLLLGVKNGPTKIEKTTTLLIVRTYLYLGTIMALWSYINDSGRVGLFGSEINFTGYTTLLLLIVIGEIQKTKRLDFIVTITLILITGSRAFLIMFFIYFLLKHIKNRTYFLLIILTLSYVLYFSAQFILIYSESIPFLKESGYINDYSRLYQLNDSSTRERIRILSLYFNEFHNSTFNLFFGFSKENTSVMIDMEPHNSLIQKTYEYGLLHALAVLISMFRKIPLYIFVFICIYGLFLHNLFSIPVIIFITYFSKNYSPT